MLLQTVSQVDRKKFSPLLVVPGPGPLKKEAENMGIRTKIVPMKWWLSEKTRIWKQPASWLLNLKSVFSISRIISREDIALVMSNSSVAFSGALASMIKKVPHIWIIHEILGRENPLVFFLFGNQKLVNLIKRFSSRIIVNSRATQNPFGNSEKIRLVYNGLEIKNIQSFHEKNLRKEFGFTEKDLVLGVVGKICKEKGQREVIMAVASVVKDYPEIKLLLVGEVKEKRYHAELLKLVQKRQLEKKVFFTGYRKDILEVLRLMDLLVVASEIESFGRVAIEAMSVGTPVLAVQSEGIREIITDGKDGFLVDSRKPEVLSNALRAVLGDRLKREEVASEGCRLVSNKFSLSSQVRKIEDVMEECLEES